ncbi:MAG: S-methyl-5-thioribose-1-phosphate isomerase [Candidatus Lokiarchaeota archaeon]|nr:S-methyl-5-thioribose-1-phosphate isomerase [Candidatus Lokiarchaeota archaeon]
MEQLLKDAERIRSLEIQGASNVAISAIDFLSRYAKRIDCIDLDNCISKLQDAKKLLEETRVTEPAMRNGLNYIMNKIKNSKTELDVKEIPAIIEVLKNEYKTMFQASKRKIAEIGARRIPDMESDDDFIVMTHCHSSAVSAILLEAKKQGKDNFKVINTETQPRLQGRKTAKKLLSAGIEVMYVVDSAMRWAVNHFEVDMIIVGADSITSEGTVLNKIGTRLLALVAHEEHVPFYVASQLLKYNPDTTLGILEKIEMREPKEIWDYEHKNLTILNPAFETVSRRYIDGLITEAGIFASSHVPNYFAKLYPDLIS